MKKYIISGVVVLALVLYVIKTHLGGSTSPVTATDNTPQQTVPVTTPEPDPSPTPAPTPIATPTAQYKDGQYTGSVADAFYGPLQVKAIIKGGLITDVQFLQYPNDRENSIEVNNRSNPLLKAEAIQAQSANVDIVSGATQSSEAFQKSLAVALAQAK